MDSIDLRSDTVTWPTPEMREAMAQAEVDDDVYGTDPTMNRLQAEAADMFGKEAALFVASGTMGNLTSVLSHCGRGDEMILGDKAHIFRYEAGGSAALGGVMPHTVPVQHDGTLALEDIRAAIRPLGDAHFPPTRLVCLENTQGSVGGVPLTVEYTRQVRALCDDHGLKLHVDGARIFNAAAALGVDVKALAAPADSLSFCLSKGLCAPVGSIIVGSHEFIERAHRIRKMLGGGMRQTGILAAAGLIAIHTMSRRLGEDHDNARRLAKGLAAIPGILIDLTHVRTNIILFELAPDMPVDAPTLSELLWKEYRIKISPRGTRSFRAVTHYWITSERVEMVLEAFRTVLARAAA